MPNDKFGFDYTKKGDPYFNGSSTIRTENEFFLPHSCDAWSIAWGDRQAIINGVEAFIKEAQEVLARFKGEDA